MLNRRIVQCLSVAALLATTGMADAACYDPRQALPAQTISNFLGNPGQLLTQHPEGGAQLISQIRDLVASDPATLQPIVGLLGSANGNQQSGIGSGLGQAYRICLRPDQGFATSIQQAIASSSSSPAKDAYALINPDTAIGSAGGGGAGTGTGGATGGSSGSTVIGGPGSALANNGTANPGSSVASGASVSGAGGLSQTTSSTSTVSGQ